MGRSGEDGSRSLHKMAVTCGKCGRASTVKGTNPGASWPADMKMAAGPAMNGAAEVAARAWLCR